MKMNANNLPDFMDGVRSNWKIDPSICGKAATQNGDRPHSTTISLSIAHPCCAPHSHTHVAGVRIRCRLDAVGNRLQRFTVFVQRRSARRSYRRPILPIRRHFQTRFGRRIDARLPAAKPPGRDCMYRLRIAQINHDLAPVARVPTAYLTRFAPRGDAPVRQAMPIVSPGFGIGIGRGRRG